jgi:SSS family solute:Na+ symporter
MDIYRKFLAARPAERELVRVGRIASAVALVTAGLIAPQLGGLQQVFQFIQEYTGFVTPGVMAIFVFALFWKRTTSAAALAAAILTIPVSAFLKLLLPGLGFLNRMGITFVLLSGVMVVMTLLSKAPPPAAKPVVMGEISFKTPLLFNVLALSVIGTVAALYLYFW